MDRIEQIKANVRLTLEALNSGLTVTSKLGRLSFQVRGLSEDIDWLCAEIKAARKRVKEVKGHLEAAVKYSDPA